MNNQISENWEFNEKEGIGTLHTRCMLVGAFEQIYVLASRNLDQLPPKTKELVSRILEIPGTLSFVVIEKHSLSIKKSQLFTWEEIAPKIQELVDQYMIS
jgi:hypothetical protein